MPSSHHAVSNERTCTWGAVIPENKRSLAVWDTETAITSNECTSVSTDNRLETVGGHGPTAHRVGQFAILKFDFGRCVAVWV